jgi:hypothetical protein
MPAGDNLGNSGAGVVVAGIQRGSLFFAKSQTIFLAKLPALAGITR